MTLGKDTLGGPDACHPCDENVEVTLRSELRGWIDIFSGYIYIYTYVYNIHVTYTSIYQRKFRLRNFRYTNDISVKLSQVE